MISSAQMISRWNMSQSATSHSATILRIAFLFEVNSSGKKQHLVRITTFLLEFWIVCQTAQLCDDITMSTEIPWWPFWHRTNIIYIMWWLNWSQKSSANSLTVIPMRRGPVIVCTSWLFPAVLNKWKPGTACKTQSDMSNSLTHGVLWNRAPAEVLKLWGTPPCEGRAHKSS